jgi:hypothetical protein
MAGIDFLTGLIGGASKGFAESEQRISKNLLQQRLLEQGDRRIGLQEQAGQRQQKQMQLQIFNTALKFAPILDKLHSLKSAGPELEKMGLPGVDTTQSEQRIAELMGQFAKKFLPGFRSDVFVDAITSGGRGQNPSKIIDLSNKPADREVNFLKILKAVKPENLDRLIKMGIANKATKFRAEGYRPADETELRLKFGTLGEFLTDGQIRSFGIEPGGKTALAQSKVGKLFADLRRAQAAGQTNEANFLAAELQQEVQSNDFKTRVARAVTALKAGKPEEAPPEFGGLSLRQLEDMLITPMQALTSFFLAQSEGKAGTPEGQSPRPELTVSQQTQIKATQSSGLPEKAKQLDTFLIENNVRSRETILLTIVENFGNGNLTFEEAVQFAQTKGITQQELEAALAGRTNTPQNPGAQ